MRRAIAALLLVLAASPFTAPFETCDMLTLFGAQAPVVQHYGGASPAATLDQSQAVAFSPASRRARARARVSSLFVVVLTRSQTARNGIAVERRASNCPRTLVRHSPIPLRV